MASSEVLSQTLYSITSIKLSQLDKQKSQYESAKQSLLRRLATEADLKSRTTLLADHICDLPAMEPITDNAAFSLQEIKRFLVQADHDPSVSNAQIQAYEDTLMKQLDVHSEKYRFAELYGKLVNEWISAGQPGRHSTSSPANLAPASDAASDHGSETSSFVPVGRAEMHEQRDMWEDYVFRPKETDSAAITDYLDGLFRTGSKDAERALAALQRKLKNFQERWDHRVHFDDETLTSCITQLLRTDILSDQKRATLNDFLNNKVVLREIADVLNMRMQTRSTWAWDHGSPCVIDQRRQLNGRYRFFPDEDLLQTLFIHYIGKAWGVQMREVLLDFFDQPGVAKSPVPSIPKQDARRRRFFLQHPREIRVSETMQGKLEEHFRNEILLDQLPAALNEKRGGYGDGGNGKRTSAWSTGEKEDTRQSHIAVVQNLLRIIQTNIIVQTKLGRSVSVVRSDFKWFGPSIPHSSLFAVLAFFGVQPAWVDFFRKVLECPLRFKDEAEDAPIRLRRRGTPLSTPIADFFAESMLFCLDFAVNQFAEGTRLYRLHDDMWLCGNSSSCASAWETIINFTELMGLGINETKTGSVTVAPKGTHAAESNEAGSRDPQLDLPPGDVTWGFLKLDAETGRFILDDAQVDAHIDELRLQLTHASRSVLDWIQAWNLYGSRFLTTNSGTNAHCYGRDRVDKILQAFSRIQSALFHESSGGVGGQVRRMISERFDISATEVPDGYLYLPISLGGLGLQNPFVGPYLFREEVCEDPGKLMDELLEEEEALYRQAKTRYEGEDGERVASRFHGQDDDYSDLEETPIFSLEEFSRYRERTSAHLGRVFEKLRTVPEPRPLGSWSGWDALSDESDLDNLSPYEEWVCRQHAQDMVARFGNMVIVKKGLLPMGLIEMLRQSRFKWQV